jgi:hypothetical protein
LREDNPVPAAASALRAGPIIIEKTDEEKAEIIGAALESWISEMVTHYKNDVHAWDVVNEPMNDAGNLRSSAELNGANPASDIFYWQDYLGKDYAVTAFKLARQYGNADDKLFINDYGLENWQLPANGLKFQNWTFASLPRPTLLRRAPSVLPKKIRLNRQHYIALS